MTASTTPNAVRNALTGVLAAVLVAGCASAIAAPRTDKDKTAKAAQVLLAKGKADQAIPLLEGVVAANPGDAALRAMLGHAYLKAGRFDSAVSALGDAMTLGDNSARTALALALANAATGRQRAAVGLLDDWRDSIPAGDLGLALALSGDTARGAAILADALRGGENTAKLRQNLAYAYALDGRWREARLMVATDLPADQVDARLTQWAAAGAPENAPQRVAALLGVQLRSDPGMPTALALSASPAVEQLAVETAAVQPVAEVAQPEAELAPVGSQAAPAMALANYTPPAPVAVAEPVPEPVAVPIPAEPAVVAAFAEAAPAEAASGVQFYSSPVVQPLPLAALAAFVPPARGTSAGRVRSAALTYKTGGSHLVQLGSFASPQGARRAWGIFTGRNPGLRNFRMTITPAVVRGKNFWRVAAAGFDGGAAQGMCASVKRRGGVCFAYSATRAPVPARKSGSPLLARR